MRFTESCAFSGDPLAIRARVSNLDAIPTYWNGTKEFKVIGRGEITSADVVFAFGGKRNADIIVDEMSMTLNINMWTDHPGAGDGCRQGWVVEA